MGSISAYPTSRGKRYRVIYRRPDHLQTQKRGFKTKREAELFLASVEIDKSRDAYIDPSKSRVLVGEWLDAWMDSRADWRATSRERARGDCRTPHQAETRRVSARFVEPWRGADMGRKPLKDPVTGKRAQDC